MPELPEVQTVVNDLIGAGIQGQIIYRMCISWEKTVIVSHAALLEKIKGKRVLNVWRRAKYIVFDLDGGLFILIHLRMTGRLHFAHERKSVDRHEHVIIKFKNGNELRLHDTRKFGRVYVTENLADVIGHLGPEPLEKSFTVSEFAKALKKHTRILKPLLLDQTFLAGLGNIYVDEALYDAQLHPCRVSNTLMKHEIVLLHRAIKKVLRRGIKNMGTTLGNGQSNFYSVARRKGRNREQLSVFRRTGKPCKRCGSSIQRIVVGQRGTHICPTCQRLQA